MRKAGIIKLILIIILLYTPSTTPVIAQTVGTVNTLETNKIDEYMKDELERLHIPGAQVAIVKDNKIQYVKGYGISNPNGKEMTSQTPVVIGSVSKSFTALAIMQLVDLGKIKLDNPVQHYIPWFKLADVEATKEITIRQLLNHTSGISEMDGQHAITEGDQSIKELVTSLNSLQLTKKVGEAYQYSNLNYSILGLVIEEVTKTAYDEYIRNNIYEPLQMRNSFADPKEDKNNTTAIGFQTIFGFKKPSEQLEHEANVPHGYLVSSAEDMANYMTAIINKGNFQGERVLSEQSINEMHQPSSLIGNDFYYAMGWEVNNELVTHNGWTENTFSRVVLDEEYGITLLINAFDYFNSSHYDQIALNLHNFVKHNEPLETSEENPFMFYIIFDLLTALVMAYILISIYKIFKHQKGKKTPFLLTFNIVSIIIFNIAIPLLILYFITKVQSLSAVVLFAPGIGHALFIIPIILIIIGVINISKLVYSGVSVPVTSR